jgi:hypothetical protein
MWCAEVAAGAFLTFCNVVSGDIGDHGRYTLILAKENSWVIFSSRCEH